MRAATPQLDGLRLAIITNRLGAVCSKMANTLYRTGRSGVLNTARDFSCCIITHDYQLLSVVESQPIHVLAGPDEMARTMVELHDDVRRGDAYIHNSPYHGCSHAADHTIIVPIIDDEGVYRFAVEAKAHQSDCGNSVPTTVMATAHDVYEEGALIFPATRIQRDYRDVDDILRMCELRIRAPEQWYGDYLAMLGAARVGERELLALGREIGWDVLEAFTAEWFDYSEGRMIEALRDMPKGTQTVRNRHDATPGSPPDGIPVEVTVSIDPEAAYVDIDLRNNPDSMPNGLNLNKAAALTAALLGLFNSIDHTVPANAGRFRRVRVHLREDCCVGITRHPTSCSAATCNLSDRVINGVQRAIAELADGCGLAEGGPVLPPGFGAISGTDPRTDEYYVNFVMLGFGCGPGAPTEDAWLSLGTVGVGGIIRYDSIEVDELRFPMFVSDRRCVPDTEGAGRFCGAPNVLVEFGPTHGDMQIGFSSDGVVNPARGARGGDEGAPARQHRRTRNGELVELDSWTPVLLCPGETVVSYAAGGGGYGPAMERAPERVVADVREGWISRQRAQAVYGVVVDGDGTLDDAATAQRRTQPSPSARGGDDGAPA